MNSTNPNSRLIVDPKALLRKMKKVCVYDPIKGTFTRIKSYGKRLKAGEPWGHFHHGYTAGCINSEKYPCSKLAWLWVYGEYPKEIMDHINRDRADDRIVNLRKASESENHWNIGMKSCNTSGFKGVTFNKQTKKYNAYITVRYVKKNLGGFATPEEAHAKYVEASKLLHGEFSPHG